MTTKKSCPDCGTEMTEGYVPEFGTVGLAGPKFWHPGQPQHKSDPHRPEDIDPSSTIEISVFRCPNCGLLREYAL